jgi:hypothetical protein
MSSAVGLFRFLQTKAHEPICIPSRISSAGRLVFCGIGNLLDGADVIAGYPHRSPIRQVEKSCLSFSGVRLHPRRTSENVAVSVPPEPRAIVGVCRVHVLLLG